MANRGENTPAETSVDGNFVRERNVADNGSNNPGLSGPPVVNSPDAQHSVRRIDHIARHIGAKSYLEIGVSRGATFNRVAVARKVGVDPHFRFEIDNYRNENTELHALTSDRYFTDVAGMRKFDIVFLDGLHQFHQTFRDFCNSLLCSHERTIWLIDDVFPVDVYSALPLQRESIKFRKSERNDNSRAWHGDVYKVIFAVHDFFPMMSYVTLMGNGNPQTIAWKTPRKEFLPVFNSMEKIERLGYFDMLNHVSILNGKPENEALEIFFASVSGTLS